MQRPYLYTLLRYTISFFLQMHLMELQLGYTTKCFILNYFSNFHERIMGTISNVDGSSEPAAELLFW